MPWKTLLGQDRAADGAISPRRSVPSIIQIEGRYRRGKLGAPSPRDRRMKLYYGWVVVAAGIVVTCIGFGAAMSLAVFMQPIAAETGWSRTAVSTAATITFLSMGLASMLWGALSDRYGTRLVVT